ncbi:MAG: hypothetical protein ACKO1K_01425 [Burkholderiales bacterium]
MSMGEAQRVAIARAVLNKPALLADKPTSALDDVACPLRWTCYSTRRESGATLIVATHDQRIVPRFSGALRLGAVADQEAT